MNGLKCMRKNERFFVHRRIVGGNEKHHGYRVRLIRVIYTDIYRVMPNRTDWKKLQPEKI